MNTISKLSAALLLLGFTVFAANAQSDDATQNQKDENIVIHKKGTSNEKFTIVVDGDKVTVNGKPLSDFKDDNVQVITDDDNRDMTTNVMPFAPLPPHGGAMAFGGDFMHNNKAFLGVMSEKVTNGVKVTDITKGSPAEKAGLQKEDVITKVGDVTVESPDDLYKAIGKYGAGDKVSISFLRNGKANTATATLDKNENDPKIFFDRDYNFKMPEGFSKNFSYGWDNKPRMGIEVQDIDAGNGVKITNIIDDDAPAAKAGLKEGDIITSINGRNIKSVDDLKDILKDSKEGDVVNVEYIRDGKSESAQVKFPKELKTTDL